MSYGRADSPFQARTFLTVHLFFWGIHLASCAFCSSEVQPAKVVVGDLWAYPCSVCGEYFIHSFELNSILEIDMSPQQKAFCISENILMNRSGMTVLWVPDVSRVPDSIPIENCQARAVRGVIGQNIIHSRKMRDLLLLMGHKASKVGAFSSMKISEKEMYSIKITGNRDNWSKQLRGFVLINGAQEELREQIEKKSSC